MHTQYLLLVLANKLGDSLCAGSLLRLETSLERAHILRQRAVLLHDLLLCRAVLGDGGIELRLAFEQLIAQLAKLHVGRLIAQQNTMRNLRKKILTKHHLIDTSVNLWAAPYAACECIVLYITNHHLKGV